jgi:hypothetical protein
VSSKLALATIFFVVVSYLDEIGIVLRLAVRGRRASQLTVQLFLHTLTARGRGGDSLIRHEVEVRRGQDTALARLNHPQAKCQHEIEVIKKISHFIIISFFVIV